MIEKLDDEILKFINIHFAAENDFGKLCDACCVKRDWLINTVPAEKRIMDFLVWLESLYDDFIPRLYNALRLLKPGQKKEIDKLFKLFSGFDLILYQVLSEKFNCQKLKKFCDTLDIPLSVIQDCTDIEDAAIQMVYYSKQTGLPEKMIRSLKQKFPQEPLISELERATLQQTENLFLVSFPFMDTASASAKMYINEIGKYFTTNTSQLYQTTSPFSVNRILDYCELLRDAIDRYAAIIFILGEDLNLDVTDEAIELFKTEYFCAYFKKVSIYVFCSAKLQGQMDNFKSIHKASRPLELLSDICKWQISKKGKPPVIFSDTPDLSRQMVRYVDQLIAKPIIVANFITPQLTSDKLDKFSGKKRNKIFISYSQKDKEWLEKVKTHLSALKYEIKLEEKDLEFWDDTCINSGDNWNEKIMESLNSAGVALLLISPHFLASGFIQDVEVPFLLKEKKHDKDGSLKIIPLILSNSRFKESADLSKFQAINLNEPLASLNENDQNAVLGKLAGEIKEHLMKKIE